MVGEAINQAGPSGKRLRVWRVLAVLLTVMLAPWARGADLQLVRHPLAAGALNAAPLGRLPETNRLRLAIGLPLRDREGLTNLLRDLYDPTSTNFHHYLSVAEFTERFGPTTADYEAVAAFAQNHGLQVVTRHPNRLILDVEGTVGEVEQALHVQMNRYAHPSENREYFAPDGDPKLELGVSVLGISGLDNYALPRPRFHMQDATGNANATPNVGSGPFNGYMGQDFRTAYGGGTLLKGTGQTVALLQFDGYTASDITSYESLAGLPAVPLSNVLLDGFSGLPTMTGGEVEVSLDIEMAISMAPGLTQVILYEAGPNGNFDDILSRMASDNLARQISCSWYLLDAPADPVADGLWQEMAAQGQSFFNASGDNDSYSGLISFPGDSPYITQVGGTTLTMSGFGGGYVSEVVWNRGGGVGSGGGISTQYAIPSWQTGISMAANYGSTTMRNTPDVALTAENVYVRADGGDQLVGGTSCAAPLWAGFMALINQQAQTYRQPAEGFFNPVVYGLGKGTHYAAAFNDISVGNNGSATHFPAVAGYDLATGWGTPKGQPMIDVLIPPDPLIISPVNGFTSVGAVGGPFSVSQESLLLTNVSASALTWTAGASAGWLSVAPTNGTVGGTGTTNVVVSLNMTASNLPPGNYTAQLLVTNQTSGFVHQVNFGLTVHDPLVITPGSGFAAVGPVGGPFNISVQSYALSNSGLASLTWSLRTNNAAWLSAASAGGALGPGLSTNVVVSLNGVASNLVAALYNGDLLFSNQTLGLSQDLQFSLRTGELPVNNNGFELGSFADWTLSGNTIGEQVTTNLVYVHSGLHGAELGPEGSLGHLSQNLVTVPGQVYLISFWLENPGIAVANEFQVNWEGSKVYDQMNLGTMGWTNVQVEVAALTTNTVLDFGFENNGYEFGLDDVAVYEVTGVATNPPVITSQPVSQVLTAGWAAQFTAGVSGIPPLIYQWQKGGSNLAGATNGTLLYSPVTVGEAGTYRLVVSNAFGVTNSSNAVLTVNVPVCDPAPAGLVSWWAGEGNANDSFGTNNGTLEGGVSFGGGETGQAFNFDGVSGTVVVPDSSSLRLTNQLTIEAWIKPLSTNGSQSIVAKVGGAGGDNGYQFALVNNELAGLLSVPAEGWPTYYIETPVPIILGTWNHVAWTYNQSAMILYFNGQPVATNVIGPQVIATAVSNLRISGDDNQHVYFDGQIDEASVYSNALSAAQIQGIYNAGSAGKCPSPPIIVSQPVSNAVVVGNSAAFGVAARGTRPLSYQWFLGTNPISGVTNVTATSATLILTNVQLGQSGGIYSVVVSNAFGVTNSSNATLTVILAPPCVPPPVGIVALWSGEGNAKDSMGTNSGALVGGVTFATGEVGQAFNFDGFTGYVTNPVAILPAVSNSFTVEFWAWPTGNRANTPQSTTGIAGISNQRYAIFPHQPIGTPAAGVGVSVGTNGISVFEHADTYLPSLLVYNAAISGWTHIAVVYNNKQPSLYVNGVLVGTGLTSPRSASFASTGLGEDGHGYGYYSGLLDEVSIYDRPLSTVEIQGIYNASSSGKCTMRPAIVSQPSNQSVFPGGTAGISVSASGTQPLAYQWFQGANPILGTSNATATNATLVLTNLQLSQSGGIYSVVVTNMLGSTNSSNAMLTVTLPPVCDPAPSGLVSWWAAEGNANDAVGTNNGTLQGGAGYATGEEGQAFNFDGMSGTMIVPDSSSLRLTSRFTIEAWIKPLDTNSTQSIVAKVGGAGGLNGYQFALGNGELTGLLNVPGGGWPTYFVQTSIPIVVNAWSHVAWTYNQSAMILYFNGQPVATNVIGPQVIATSVSNLRLSGDDNQHVYFDGEIDEASVYNTALSAAQILAIYNAGSAGKCPVPVAPVITNQPSNAAVVLGNTASFSVGNTGSTPISYQWFFNNGAISQALNPSAGTATLTLANVQATNAGSYSVLVTNLAGSTNSTNAQLTILFPPAFTANPVGDSVGQGCAVSFSAAATGTGLLSYQWQKDGSNVVGQTGTNLTILHVQPGDFGGYALIASNNYGTVTSTVATLLMDYPPVPAGTVVQRYPSGGIHVNVSTLLAGATDPDGDPVSFVGISTSSAAGGTVGLTNGVISYLPPPGYTNSDAFSYTLSDGHCGGTAVGTVLVQVRTDLNSASQITTVRMPDGSLQVNFNGIPGYAYRVQSTASLSAPAWQDVATLTADAFGNYTYVDHPATNGPARFYRSVWP